MLPVEEPKPNSRPQHTSQPSLVVEPPMPGHIFGSVGRNPTQSPGHADLMSIPVTSMISSGPHGASMLPQDVAGLAPAGDGAEMWKDSMAVADLASPFSTEDGLDPALLLSAGAGSADPMFFGADPAQISHNEAGVKLETDMDVKVPFLGVGGGQVYNQVNPQLMQGFKVIAPHASTDSEKSTLCPESEMFIPHSPAGGLLRKHSMHLSKDEMDMGVQRVQTAPGNVWQVHGGPGQSKRLCLQDPHAAMQQGATTRFPQTYQLVRSTGNGGGFAVCTQPAVERKPAVASPPTPTGQEGASYFYQQDLTGMMTPVMRRHSTGSPGYVLSGSGPSGNYPSMSQAYNRSTINQRAMMQVQDTEMHPVPQVPIMGPGGNFRVNSAPALPLAYQGVQQYDQQTGLTQMHQNVIQETHGLHQVPENSQEDGAKPAKRRVHKKRENLPKESTALLKQWLLSHMLLPYPGNEEKIALCRATNLDMSQINNWFINARVRIWKPLVLKVFEKYEAELRRQAMDDDDEHQLKRIQDAHKSSTMNMITLLSGLQTARKELDEIAGKSKAIIKDI